MQARLDPRLAALRSELAGFAPGRAHAAVAAMLRPTPGDLELLLIVRAERVGDPWSGHVALPGGRREPHDADDVATAMRETREEVGIELAGDGILLGGLSPVAPRSDAGTMRVAPWVFAVPAHARAAPNAEVRKAQWVGLGELAAPSAQGRHQHATPSGAEASFAALRVHGLVIWGMTLRVVNMLLRAAGHSTE